METMLERTPAVQAGGSVRGALAALSLSILLPSLATSSANVGLPELSRVFGLPFKEVQWVVLAYLVAVSALSVFAGRLGDVAGRRRMLLAGVLVFTAASLQCALAPTIELLIAGRALQGVGAALMLALAMAFVSEAVPEKRTGSAMGLLGTMSAVGTALGPTLGGFALAGFGWRAIFWLNVPLGLVAGLLAWRWLPAAPARAGMPLLRLALLRDRSLAAGFAMSALVMTVMMATLVVGPFYLAGTLGLDAARVGMVMSCGPVVSALVGVPAGRLVDRWGAGTMRVAGLGGMLVGALALALLGAGQGGAGYVVALAGLTAGYALFQAANNTAVMGAARREEKGVVSGLLSLSRNVGLMAGTAGMGAVFAYGVGTAQVMGARPLAIEGGMHVTFAVGVGIVAAALVIGLRGVRR